MPPEIWRLAFGLALATLAGGLALRCTVGPLVDQQTKLLKGYHERDRAEDPPAKGEL